MTGSCHDNAVPGLRANNKAGFDHGDDGEATSVAKHVSWNTLFWHATEIADDVGTMVNAFLLVGPDRGHKRERRDKDKREYSFH